MNVFVGILVCIAATIYVILWWDIIIYCIAGWYSSRQTIEDVKENIIECLDKADGLGYETIFRTPECVAYKYCKLHVAKTEDGKKVIMIDLI